MRRLVRRALLTATIGFALLAFAALACIVAGYLRAGSAIEEGAQKFGPPSVELSTEQLRVLLRVEDPAFLEHHGVDLRTPGAGLTTITQGLVKILYFERFKPGFAKMPQTFFAIGLDAAVSKKEQLRLFESWAYFGTEEGKPVIGFADAARHYFGRDLGALSSQEFAALVAMLIAPDSLDPKADATANAERVRRIERLVAGACEPLGLRDVYYEGCR